MLRDWLHAVRDWLHRDWLHVHRWNLWTWTARNERAWMRCMDRQMAADARIAVLESRLDTLTATDKVTDIRAAGWPTPATLIAKRKADAR